jgi:hypothetical protein
MEKKKTWQTFRVPAERMICVPVEDLQEDLKGALTTPCRLLPAVEAGSWLIWHSCNTCRVFHIGSRWRTAVQSLPPPGVHLPDRLPERATVQLASCVLYHRN